MFDQLLLGLRDVRTPLAAGYLWLFDIYLSLGRFWPASLPATPFEKQMTDLVHWLPMPSLLVILSFMAFVLGTVLDVSCGKARLLVSRSSGPEIRRIIMERKLWELWKVQKWRQLLNSWKLLNEDPAPRKSAAKGLRRHFGQAGADVVAAHISKRVEEALHELPGGASGSAARPALDRGCEALGEEPGASSEDVKDYVADQLAGEVFGLVERLGTERPSLQERYSQLQAESSLRLNVSLPLVVMGLVCLITTAFAAEPWADFWALTAGLAASATGLALFLRGAVQVRSVGDLMASALTENLVRSPTLERVTAAMRAPSNV